MMRIAFVQSHYENLGVEYLSAFLKQAGHQTFLVFEPGLFASFFAHNKNFGRILSFRSEIVDRVVSQRPDIVAFSVISDTYGWACDLAQEIKKRLDTFVIFGGSHPTAVPERILKQPFIDFVISGEGEEAFLELVEALEAGDSLDKIQNLSFRENDCVISNPLRPPRQDLDSFPFPDKDLFFNEYNGLVRNAYMAITSRGCFYSCSYCVNSILNSLYPNRGYFRRRSVDNVMEELLHAKNKYGIKKVTFYDEDLLFDKKWLAEFLPRYRAFIKLPFFCCVFPSHLDKESAQGLSESGCEAVNIGLQTSSEEYRRTILRRPGSNKHLADALDTLRENKIFVYSNVIIGLPGQTEQELMKTLEFCVAHPADVASIYWLRYYPKTPIVGIAREMGVLSADDVEAIEESKEYRPYAIKGSSFDRKMSKIGNLILFSGFFPSAFTRFVIKRKIYRYVPSLNLLFPAIMVIGLYKKIFHAKKNPFHYFGILDYIQFYIFYIGRKLHGSFFKTEGQP